MLPLFSILSPGKTLGSLSLAVTPASLNSGALTTVDETLLADAEREDCLLAVTTSVLSSCCEVWALAMAGSNNPPRPEDKAVSFSLL